ncbi:deleted in azoospermia-like isoform X2 [Nelusetta ayraudi]|uniref:deleted in azoospermia-like isoform X2 n=1 Tax=Nelusetta ayraudi TaxID=303726 RepID=UPI003F6E5479
MESHVGGLGRGSLRLPNGYLLPEGKVTPNALFVGGIDLNVSENEMAELFSLYGSVKEVKIITYRGGICKGYGFVYFNEDVNVQSIIEQQMSLKGRKLKLGPAILKERSPRSRPPRLFGPLPPPPRMSTPQYYCCTCCSPVGRTVTQPPPPMYNASSPYSQPYTFSNSAGYIGIPQIPVNYAQSPYAYENFVDCGVQTMVTVM